jgi:ABC-type transporter Mla MlaB component
MTLDAATTGRLALDGALTIRTAEAVSAKLLDAVNQHSSLSVDCSDVTEVDLSFIQLLIAARVSAQSLQKSVVLGGRPEGALLDTLTRGGYRVAEEAQQGKAVFWFSGAGA